jgi:hypothetical protein
MLKPFTMSLSLSLAVALGACSSSMASGFGSGCSTCLASPQGVAPSAQGYASPQCAPASPCGGFGGLKGLCCGWKMPKINWPKPTCTYEWVLKKKVVWCRHTAGASCGTCGGGGVYPSAQGGYASPQAYGSAQAGHAYGSGQAYGAAQAVPTAGHMTPAAPAPTTEEAPPAPSVPAPTAPTIPTPEVPAPAAPAPAAPAPGAAAAPTSSLLFSSPAGN